MDKKETRQSDGHAPRGFDALFEVVVGWDGWLWGLATWAETFTCRRSHHYDVLFLLFVFVCISEYHFLRTVFVYILFVHLSP